MTMYLFFAFSQVMTLLAVYANGLRVDNIVDRIDAEAHTQRSRK